MNAALYTETNGSMFKYFLLFRFLMLDNDKTPGLCPGLYPAIKVLYGKNCIHVSIYFVDVDMFLQYVHVYVSRRVRKEGRVHRSVALETAAMTAGTLRGVSLCHHRSTLEITPSTGERHQSTETHSHKYMDAHNRAISHY